MELGKRIRQARLEAGLSQRQLCGEQITRNMLSQIENGSAKPSMDTLRYLAAQLHKPIGYFLEEQVVTSPNQAVMEQARQAQGVQVLEILASFREPDAVFSNERYLLEALACMDGARDALRQGKHRLAKTLLEQCARAGERTPYYTAPLERERVLLCYGADPAEAEMLAALLPEDDREPLLRAQAALVQGQPERAQDCLRGTAARDDRWYWLMGQSCLAQKAYEEAAAHLERIEAPDTKVFMALEQCCRELEDYKGAYEYACKLRELEKIM